MIGWLKEASVKAVAGRMRLSWHAVDGIMQRAVARGLARRRTEAVRRLSVDETSFRRGFANAILFHLGGVDLYPDGLPA